LKTVRCELIEFVGANESTLYDKSQGATAALPSSAACASAASRSPAPPCAALSQHVVETSSHLGISIGDDGGSLAVVDEHGQRIELPRLAATLAAASGSELHIAQTNVPESAYLAVHAARAGVGCCAGSRIWFADEYPPLADPLAALTALLVLLSQSDRGLSEVLDEDTATR
jgi:hypothetical protein